MTAETDRSDVYLDGDADSSAEEHGRGFRLSRLFGPFGSSLTRRIVVLNLAGLVALLCGILYLNQFRAGLIEARTQSMLIQGEIIAGAIAASGTADNSSVWVDPDKLMNISPGEMFSQRGDTIDNLEFPINPERVAPLLRRLVSPTRTRARIYDSYGALLLDSQSLYNRGDILRFDLPPPPTPQEMTLLGRLFDTVRGWIFWSDVPPYKELAGVQDYPEIVRALAGAPASEVRRNQKGEMIVSVAVPIQRFQSVAGVLLLSTLGGDIDKIVQNERMAIVRVFLVAAVVMIVLSILLAGTIAGPVRRLANAAERVRNRINSRTELPDFSDRSDEIGHLSKAFREMTDALYNRMEAIEAFAADVAHELKNPLTSLRSAVETLPLAKTEATRKRLLEVIEHDIRRLDRLISDISDASRLDAELQLQERDPIDVGRLLTAVVGLQNEIRSESGVPLRLIIADNAKGKDRLLVFGHDSRLGQVITNLVDNARSFSEQGSEVRVICRRLKNEIEIAVEDEGPGIRPDAVERVFERFYTDRPSEGFGQNSGLGLSISKQIVEAHKGRIWAENRVSRSEKDEDGQPKIIGARFVVRLPAAVR
ncbi:stimulus-sensing domain-containing protein [Flaviflagellibacter deserti]|uniref:histidine kinase n=1 Tax=Flaviflagellibacter deserti TaxID=2267266 RepID=A0ABV9Z0Q9_9HYPH